MFGQIKLAFRYGRLISADLRTSELDKYDRAFKSYLRNLVEGEDEKVKEELKKCEQLSGNNVLKQYLLFLVMIREGS